MAMLEHNTGLNSQFILISKELFNCIPFGPLQLCVRGQYAV